MRDLQKIHKLSLNTLKKVVTDEGIFASTGLGLEGLYHGFFGRDTAITAHLISLAEYSSENKSVLYDAIKGLVQLMKWQGQKDDADTGEEEGKFTHEVRTYEADYQHLTVGMINQGRNPWYVDPNDKVLKNWDSIDATQLWTVVISRMIEKNLVPPTEEIRLALKKALLWCIKRLKSDGGFIAYKTAADRKWGGLINHTWKDSELSYLFEDGKRPVHPIKDVFVNALTWAALRYGSKIFATYDSEFAKLLEQEAAELKKRFNDPETGFLMKDEKGNVYFAEAIDSTGQKLTEVSCDAALILWAYVDNECIIEQKYIRKVVKRVMMKDMFDSKAGIRTYSAQIKSIDPVLYHRGPNTFWPFVSALIAEGIDHFGYKVESRKILRAMIRGIKKFDSCIEMFIKNGELFEKFREPNTGQLSCTEQAWTAAASYYATQVLTQNQS